MRYRDFMKIPEFQQVGIDNGEYETNRIVQSPTFNEEREDPEIKKKREDNGSRPILSANFHVRTFFHVSFFFCILGSADRCLPLSF